MTRAVTVPESMTSTWSQIVGEIEADLARRVDRLDLPQALKEAIRYALFGGAKRLRPVLTLMSCEAVGGRRAAALAPAAAIELIHTFSLVHDDLPAMDDDHLRRGRPTLHLQAGEAMAILAGDCLQTLAFQWILDAKLPGGVAGLVARELAGATIDMIAGQVLDTLGGFPADTSPARRLELIHRNKTGALIRAACRMGALCGGADGELLGALSRYGAAVGMMFQIVDDLLDVTQTTEHIGKAAGKDKEAGKLTYPHLFGTDASRQAVDRLQAEAREALEPLGEAGSPLLELCDYMAVRTR